MTYYDRLNAFFLENEIDPLPPSAQLLYLHLLHENNRLRNPSVLYMTDSRLAFMTGLSRPAVTDAKRQLKNRGLVNFKTDKKNPRSGTRYVLPEEGDRKFGTAGDGQRIETTDAAISAELKKAWEANNDGAPPSETETYYLAEDVKVYGEEKVRQAVIRAGQKKRGMLSIYFYKMQLGDVISGRKERTGNARRNTGTGNRAVSECGLYGREDVCPEG